MKLLMASFLLSLFTSSCTKQEKMPENTATLNGKFKLTYLALGDSYTIGESVTQANSFPYQLQTLLNNQKLSVGNPKIIARTGWTTGELQTAIKQENTNQKYDIVTLLIGVNNQFRGFSLDGYKQEFAALLQTAINFANDNKNHVFVVSIPDWGATPYGKNSGRDVKVIANEIDAYNLANKEITLAAGVSYTDITPASRNASTDLGLVANDGLHPSGKMYSEWANALALKISTTLVQKE